jgi:hypothetical protein
LPAQAFPDNQFCIGALKNFKNLECEGGKENAEKCIGDMMDVGGSIGISGGTAAINLETALRKVFDKLYCDCCCATGQK